MILPIQNGGFPYSFLYVYQRVTSVSGNYKNWEDTLHHPTIVILCYPVICPFSDPFYCKGRLFQVDGGRSLLAPLATLGRILPPVTGAAWDDLGWLGMVRRYPTGAGSNLELIWIQLDDLTMSDLFFWNWPIDGGFKHLLFSMSYMGCHPSHWLSYFSRWFFNHQPDIHHMSIIYIYPLLWLSKIYPMIISQLTVIFQFAFSGCRCMVFLTCMSTRQAAKGWAKTSGLLYAASKWCIYIY